MVKNPNALSMLGRLTLIIDEPYDSFTYTLSQ